MSAAAVQRLALVGSPNSGKTTLFNALTGLRHKVGNYAGVTVERVEAELQLQNDRALTLIDLPGTYALEALSPDEEVTIKVLQGQMPGCPAPDGVAIIADATTLERGMQLIGEVLRLGLPTVVILTMIDELKARKGHLKLAALRKHLGVPVIGVVGNKGLGIDDVKHALGDPRTWQRDHTPHIPEDLQERIAWADAILQDAVTPPQLSTARTDAIDRVLLHPVAGIAIFAAMMFLFFQIIFAVAAPLQDLLEGGVGALGDLLGGAITHDLARSLIVDGVIGGVGGVVVFVPQIALLLLLIALLEGSGYMARAAFVIDRVMGWAGLEGRCFIALLSSYACAIPGIMATRAVGDPQSRLATIMSAPFMTCSARLPVYGLLIGAFIPEQTVAGVFNLQGVAMFALYLLGSLSALLAGFIFKRGLLRGRTYPFFMELPPYRWPTARVVGHQVWRGVKAFLAKAGRIILVASIALWALLTFPRVEPPAELADDPAAARAWQLEQSYAADLGHLIEPAIEPLGFDWKIGVGLIASLSAREVMVSTLAQIYGFDGDEEDTQGLGERLKAAKRADGSPAYPLPTVLSLLVFYVYALQCVSTLAIIRRETESWRWPTIAFTYMLAVAWIGAFATFHLTRLLGG